MRILDSKCFSSVIVIVFHVKKIHCAPSISVVFYQDFHEEGAGPVDPLQGVEGSIHGVGDEVSLDSRNSLSMM